MYLFMYILLVQFSSGKYWRGYVNLNMECIWNEKLDVEDWLNKILFSNSTWDVYDELNIG